MNGRLSKVDMTDKLLKIKRELDYKCEIGEMGAQYNTPTIVMQVKNLKRS